MKIDGMNLKEYLMDRTRKFFEPVLTLNLEPSVIAIIIFTGILMALHII